MKKSLIAVLALAMASVMLFAACGDKASESDAAADADTTVSAEADTTAATEAAAE